jgi:hypothetical protein
MDSLYAWSEEAAGLVGAPAWTGSRDAVGEILDLAKVTAHGIARPAAPVGSFLAGVAVGLRGAGSLDDLREIRRLLESIVPSGDDERDG